MSYCGFLDTLIKISGKSNITFSHIQNASGWFFEIFWLGRILYFISKWKLIFILCIPNLGPFWDSQILYFLKSCARKVETFIMANCIKSCVPNSNRQKSVTVTYSNFRTYMMAQHQRPIRLKMQLSNAMIIWPYIIQSTNLPNSGSKEFY